MYQVMGKIVHNGNVVGLMVYDYDRKAIFRATIKDCITEVKNRNMSNLVIVNNKLDTTDGSMAKLPVYDINGKSVGQNLPVIIERVTNDNVIVGYTFIDKGSYKKCKTADLVKGYKEFYNAKVVTKDGNTFLSAKRGTFRELKVDRLKEKAVSSVSAVQGRKKPTEIVYDKCKFDIIKCTDTDVVLRRYKGNDSNVVIPDGVTTIDNVAFRGCTELTSITIPNSVTEIGSGAFEGCTGLTSITIPNSVTEIGSGAFDSCTGLTSVTIGNSVTEIGSSAFYGCTGLTSITVPDSVTKIGSYAFKGCTGLTSIAIPNSVTKIGHYAFEGCANIVIYGHENSFAEWYAKNNAVDFVVE